VPSAFAACNNTEICLSGLRRLRLARSATRDSFVTSLKIYASNICSIYKILWHPDSFVSRDSIVGLAGRRAGVTFFTRHLDCFTVTPNCSSIYRDTVPFRQLHRDTKHSSVYQDWQKTRHRDADGTSLNHRAVMFKHTRRYGQISLTKSLSI
jgi:hypothetical protein